MIPKFRAWDTHEEVMNRVDYVDFVNGVIGMSNENVRDYEQPIHRVNIMQYTGLKDKNGVEIYEGDIVKMQWTIYDEPELFYIRTIEGRAPRVDNRIKGKELWLVHQDCKVVGNIYQNRELLEVAE